MKAFVLVKELNKKPTEMAPFFKTAHFAARNGPFWRAEWAVLKRKKARFEVQNESFWNRSKCKENTSRSFPTVWHFRENRVYASAGFLFQNDGTHGGPKRTFCQYVSALFITRRQRL